MSEFNNLLKEQFFIIDSNNIESMTDKFYGYILPNNNENIINKGNGSYIWIKEYNNILKIIQDFNGCYEIYLYKNNDYFAISNSFIKLVEYLKGKKPLSLNKDYADAFLFSGVCSFAYEETLINEIKILPRNYIININKKNKEINFERIDYQENSVDLDSEEGFKILDEWFSKWINIIQEIKKESDNIAVDLSGGIDSRLILALILSSNIDLKKIRIHSMNDGKHTHKDDYRIASQIAEELNFELNKNVFSTKYLPFKEENTTINLSFYTKLGFHNQMYFQTSYSLEPIYWIVGAGGENIRSVGTTIYKEPYEKFIAEAGG